MLVAIWIIVVCEVIRAIQNAMQLAYINRDKGNRENVYAEVVKSLKHTDGEFVEEVLKEFERQQGLEKGDADVE